MAQAGMMPGLDPSKLSMQEMEMIQTHQFFQQIKALEHSKMRGMEVCFEKCMDKEDLQTARRQQLDERKRHVEYKKEKDCLKCCHKKFQKAFSMAVQAHQSSVLGDKLREYMQSENPGLNLERQE